MIFEAIDPENPSAGTKLTETRAWDMNGNIPDVAMKSALPDACILPFKQWQLVFRGAENA